MRIKLSMLLGAIAMIGVLMLHAPPANACASFTYGPKDSGKNVAISGFCMNKATNQFRASITFDHTSYWYTPSVPGHTITTGPSGDRSATDMKSTWTGTTREVRTLRSISQERSVSMATPLKSQSIRQAAAANFMSFPTRESLLCCNRPFPSLT